MFLFAAGSNAGGHLGIGSTEDSHRFLPCQFLADDGSTFELPPAAEVRSIAAGGGHALLLVAGLGSDGNELWAAGLNAKGQLGPEWRTAAAVTAFRRVDLGLEADDWADFEPVVVGASWETSYVVMRDVNGNQDDVLLSYGSNDYGKLGVGPAPMHPGPHVVPLDNALPSDRRPNTVRVLELSCGTTHIIAIVGYKAARTDHIVRSVVGWGTARHGQLGSSLPDPYSPLPGCQTIPALFISPYDYFNEHQQPVLAAVGQRHSVLLLPNGSISCTGSDARGQLRRLDSLRDVKDIGCTWHGTYAIIPAGQREPLVSNGSNDHGQLGRIENEPRPRDDRIRDEVLLPHDRRILDLSCGSEHVAVLCRSESGVALEVWAWGWNEHGNLGLGHRNDVRLPERIWPPEVLPPQCPQNVVVERVWTGCGTTWILCRQS